jgi:type VI secretion system protein ImpG
MHKLIPYFEREMGILRRGLQDRDRVETTEWLPNDYGSSLEYGDHIRMTIDETAFVHRSIHAFAQVMDRFFGYYMQRKNFTRLIVQAADGRDLVRCAQRPGCQSPA